MIGGVILCIPNFITIHCNERWCDNWHHITRRCNKVWCHTLQYKLHNKSELWCDTLHYITRHCNEGWCDTLHDVPIDCNEWWRDTLHHSTRLQWRVARYLHAMTIHSNWLQRKENNACIDVAWGLYWGRSRSTKPCVLPCKVAAACNEIPRVCCGCGWGRSGRKFGSSPVFCNGWFVWLQILVKWLHDCHVLRTESRVSQVMLLNALSWLHGCCMGLVLGTKPEHETLCFAV